MIALVLGLTLNSSAQYFKTAVNGAFSGTLMTRNGSFGSDAKVTLNSTFATAAAMTFDVKLKVNYVEDAARNFLAFSEGISLNHTPSSIPSYLFAQLLRLRFALLSRISAKHVCNVLLRYSGSLSQSIYLVSGSSFVINSLISVQRFDRFFPPITVWPPKEIHPHYDTMIE